MFPLSSSLSLSLLHPPLYFTSSSSLLLFIELGSDPSVPIVVWLVGFVAVVDAISAAAVAVVAAAGCRAVVNLIKVLQKARTTS